MSLKRAAAAIRFDSTPRIPLITLVRGDPKLKEIALTFDDGPHGPMTERLLAILRQERVRATFFVVGKMVDRFPGLVRREIADGHEVANHTYDHLRLAGQPPSVVEPELALGADAIARASGLVPRFFRPPGGEYDHGVAEAAKKLGYVMVLWTDDPGDFARPGSAEIERRTLRYVQNGSILLLHDGIQQTYDILPDLIRQLKRQGYRFVTISEMVHSGGFITTGGPRVRPQWNLARSGTGLLPTAASMRGIRATPAISAPLPTGIKFVKPGRKGIAAIPTLKGEFA